MRKMIWLFWLALVLGLTACGGKGEDAAANVVDIANLPISVDVSTVAAIKDDKEVFLLDVREQWEYDEAHISGVTLIPMEEIPLRLNEIPTDQEVIITCRSGNRSGQVVEFLRQQGFTNVHNMEGGLLAWQAAGYPTE